MCPRSNNLLPLTNLVPFLGCFLPRCWFGFCLVVIECWDPLGTEPAQTITFSSSFIMEMHVMFIKVRSYKRYLDSYHFCFFQFTVCWLTGSTICGLLNVIFSSLVSQWTGTNVGVKVYFQDHTVVNEKMGIKTEKNVNFMNQKWYYPKIGKIRS